MCWSTTQASFQAGFFEEMSADAFRSQIETTLFGPVNVTVAIVIDPGPAEPRDSDPTLDEHHEVVS